MFYCPQLLTLRNRAKLSRCWFAAMTNEKMFKKMFKPSIIVETKLDTICEEILSMVQNQSERVQARFSLYLSSQLMYGAARIFSYQVHSFERVLREIRKQFDQPIVEQRSAQAFEANGTLMVPEAAMCQDFQNLELVQDQHLMRDDAYILGIESMMKDAECLNFGMLTSEEMDLILTTDGEISLERFERLQITEVEATTTSAMISSIPQISVDTSEAFPGILKKHTANSPPVETPRKRRKLLEEIPAPVPQTALSQGQLQKQVQLQEQGQVQVGEQVLIQEEAHREQEIQQEREEEAHPAQRRRRFRDRRTQLDPERIRNALADVRVYTREQPYNRTREQVHTPKLLLRLPCTMFHGSQLRFWARALLDRFTSHTRHPFPPRDEFPAEMTLPSVEELRQDSPYRAQSVEISSRLEVAQLTETVDGEPRPAKQLPLPQEHMLVHEQDHPSVPELPDITGLEEHMIRSEERCSRWRREEDSEDWLKPLIIDRDSVESRKERHKSPGTFSSIGVTVSRADLLASLEVLWHDRDAVSFKELVSPGTYDQVDAGCAFHCLLECHTEGKLILKQVAPFKEIWIQRYQQYSSSSSR